MEHAKKLALITGASSGIGFELAKIFAKEEYDLIIAAEDAAINDKASILRAFECEVTAVVADLATQEGIDRLWAQVETSGRSLDVAVLNAGVGVGGEFIRNDWNAELNMMNLNVVNLVGLTKLVLQDMEGRNSGKILFTSSTAAEMPGPYYAVYAATKAFIQSFAEAIRYEMKDTNRDITITSLQPGPTETNFFSRADMLDTPAGQGPKADAAKVAQDGYDALMNGSDHVVSGFMNKLQSTTAKLMTEGMGAAAQGRMVKPNSLQQ